MPKIITDLEIKKITNEIGSSQKRFFKFKFIKTLRIKKKSTGYDRLFVVIKNNNNIIKKIEYYLLKKGKNPFKCTNQIPYRERQRIVNKIGKKPKKMEQKFCFVHSYRKDNQTWVVVLNKKTNTKKTVVWSSVKSIKHSFFRKTLQSKIKELKNQTNNLGKQQPTFLKYKFYSFSGVRANHNDYYVKIQNIKSGDICKVSFFTLKQGHNPWKKVLTTPYIKHIVNKRGRNQKNIEKFKFKRIFKRKTLHIVIQNIHTNKKKSVQLNSILKGFPFRQNKIRKEELIITPKIINLLKRNNVKILSKNRQILKGVKPDIICEIHGNTYILEVKDDDQRWSKKQLDIQVKKYNLAGLKVFKNFKKVILLSVKGKYGISISKFQIKYLNKGQKNNENK